MRKRWIFDRPSISEMAITTHKEDVSELEKQGLTLYYPNPNSEEEQKDGIFILAKYHEG